jgi:hypothetical protein
MSKFEKWARVPGYNVEVTTDGRVRATDRSPVVTRRGPDGRIFAMLSRRAGRRAWPIHLAGLVLRAHRGPPPRPNASVDFLDGDPGNLDVTNLSWRRSPKKRIKQIRRGEKIRRCLRCRREFPSQHAGVRLCDPCRDAIAKDAAEIEVQDANLTVSDLRSFYAPLGPER